MGGSIQAILVNLWFVASMQLLLREQLTQEPKLKLILVGLASASFQIIVTAFLIVFDVHNYRSCNEVNDAIFRNQTYNHTSEDVENWTRFQGSHFKEKNSSIISPSL